MLEFYVVNAFTTERPHSGNPAAVCILKNPLSESVMQQVAAQHNLSETAFVVAQDNNRYNIRWFTPSCEVDLCGHATLAAAKVLRDYLGAEGTIYFDSASGELTVCDTANGLTLNFPVRKMAALSAPYLIDQYRATFNDPKAEVLSNGDKAMVIVSDEVAITDFIPDFSAISELPCKIVYFSAKSQSVDFVCRVFAPKAGIPEDPVTGSAYTSLAPYWAAQLGKESLTAEQRSARGGLVTLQLDKERVNISGNACTVIKGEWLIEA